MTKLYVIAGYLIAFSSIFPLMHQQFYIAYSLVLFGAWVCNGINLDQDGAGVALAIGGMFLIGTGHYLVGGVILFIGILLSYTAQENGDWAEWFWDLVKQGRRLGDRIEDDFDID